MSAALAARDWELWTSPCRIVVTDADRLDAAVAIADGLLAEVERRGQPVPPRQRGAEAPAGWNDLSPMLADLVREALTAAVAERRSGRPDPGRDAGRARLRPHARRPSGPTGTAASLRRAARARLAEPPPGRRPAAPAGGRPARPRRHRQGRRRGPDARPRSPTRSAPASWSASVATSRPPGPAPDDGWQVTVQDLPADVPQQVTLHAGAAVATSSTREAHLDPRRPHAATTSSTPQRAPRPAGPWRTVTVVATDCAAGQHRLDRGDREGPPGRWLAPWPGLPGPVDRPRGTGCARSTASPGGGMSHPTNRSQAHASAGTPMSEALWALGRGTGVVALVMFTVTIVLGIARPLGPVRRRAGPVRRQRGAPHRRPHRHDAGRRPRRVPLLRPLRPAPAGRLGVPVPRRLPAALAGPGHARGRPARRGHRGQPAARAGRARVFRTVHWATYALWPVALVHALGNGTDRASLWMLGLAAACAGAVVAAVGWRLAPSYGERGWSRTPEEAPVMTLTLTTQRLLAGLDHGPAPRLTADGLVEPGRGVRADRARRRRASRPRARSAVDRPRTRGRRQRHGGRAAQPQGRRAPADRHPHLVLDGLEILASALRARRVLLAVGHRIDPGPVREQARRAAPASRSGTSRAASSPARSRRWSTSSTGAPGCPATRWCRSRSAASTAGRRWSSTPRPWPSSRWWRATAPSGSAASARSEDPGTFLVTLTGSTRDVVPRPAWSRFRAARRCGTC